MSIPRFSSLVSNTKVGILPSLIIVQGVTLSPNPKHDWELRHLSSVLCMPLLFSRRHFAISKLESDQTGIISQSPFLGEPPMLPLGISRRSSTCAFVHNVQLESPPTSLRNSMRYIMWRYQILGCLERNLNAGTFIVAKPVFVEAFYTRLRTPKLYLLCPGLKKGVGMVVFAGM